MNYWPAEICNLSECHMPLFDLIERLALDPRPAYQEDPDRVYGMPFGGREVHFRVDRNILTVIDYA